MLGCWCTAIRSLACASAISAVFPFCVIDNILSPVPRNAIPCVLIANRQTPQHRLTCPWAVTDFTQRPRSPIYPTPCARTSQAEPTPSPPPRTPAAVLSVLFSLILLTSSHPFHVRPAPNASRKNLLAIYAMDRGLWATVSAREWPDHQTWTNHRSHASPRASFIKKITNHAIGKLVWGCTLKSSISRSTSINVLFKIWKGTGFTNRSVLGPNFFIAVMFHWSIGNREHVWSAFYADQFKFFIGCCSADHS